MAEKSVSPGSSWRFTKRPRQVHAAPTMRRHHARAGLTRARRSPTSPNEYVASPDLNRSRLRSTDEVVAEIVQCGEPPFRGNSITLLRVGPECDVLCDVTPSAAVADALSMGSDGVSGSSACAASFTAFRRTWLYTAIIAGETCPNCARVIQSGRPFSASLVRAVWRPSWNRMWDSPEAVRSDCQAVRHEVIGRVGSSCLLRPCHTKRRSARDR